MRKYIGHHNGAVIFDAVILMRLRRVPEYNVLGNRKCSEKVQLQIRLHLANFYTGSLCKDTFSTRASALAVESELVKGDVRTGWLNCDLVPSSCRHFFSPKKGRVVCGVAREGGDVMRACLLAPGLDVETYCYCNAGK